MEVEFETENLACMTPICAAWQRQEVTQEIKLTDGMPDIGRTLGAWGQVILRSKQWNSDSMIASAGISAWVMYVPEDGSEPRTMELWIPFQNTWQYPRQDREGIMAVSYQISSMDARTLSARKLMVRMTVSAFGQALAPQGVTIPKCGEKSEGVELLKKKYPVNLIREAGEKNFSLEEELKIGGEKADKLVRYTLRPNIAEEKVMGQKLVFRGTAAFHGVFRSEEGGLFAKDFEVPFSQFTELERDYGQEAGGVIQCSVTNLEPELTPEGNLQLKCGMTAQYFVVNEEMIELTEDAYGIGREVTPMMMDLELPCVLSRRQEPIKAMVTPPEELQVIDGTLCVDVPGQNGLHGTAVFAGYDSEGNLQTKTVGWEEKVPISWNCNDVMISDLRPCRVTSGGLEGEWQVSNMGIMTEAMPVVKGVSVGEKQGKNKKGPSLILRKCREDSLWQIAKTCSSTVELICSVNGLEREPEPDRMLLIPVIS